MCDIDMDADVGFDSSSDEGVDVSDAVDDTDLGEWDDFSEYSDAVNESDTYEELQYLDDVSTELDDTSSELEVFQEDSLDLYGESEMPMTDDAIEISDDLVNSETISEIGELDQEETSFDVEELPDFSELDDVVSEEEISTDPEITLSMDELQDLYEEHSEDPNFAGNMEELISSGRVAVAGIDETEEDTTDDGDIKVLTREITPEILESRNRDTEETLDNYRESLRERGVSEERIDEFIDRERNSINAMYEGYDNHVETDSVYAPPTDWDTIAADLRGEDSPVEGMDDNIANGIEGDQEDLHESDETIFAEGELSENPEMDETNDNPSELDTMSAEIEEDNPLESDLDDAIESNEEGRETEEKPDFTNYTYISFPNSDTENIDEVQDISVNYDEIYEGIDQEALEQGFEEVDIYEDTERLDSSLESFRAENWENLSLDGQKESMSDLAEYVEEVIGFDNPPTIEYYNNRSRGDYGGYNSQTNTLRINEYMLYDNEEAADTIAHELWHAHQHECAENPSSARDYQYQYNFENYIRPEIGHEAYESQLVEAEARAFAAQFKGRIAELGSRRL